VQKSANETAALFPSPDRTIRIYRLLVFFSSSIPESDFPANGLRLPEVRDREMGLHAPVGKLAGINALLIIVLAPVIGALPSASVLRIVIIGSIICTAGVFVMALPADWFARPQTARSDTRSARLFATHGPGSSVLPYVGDLPNDLFRRRSFYSPRVYEYAAAIRTPGQEASYGALAYIPFLVGKNS